MIVWSDRTPWIFPTDGREGNTGFYFVRSNNNTISIWEQFLAVAENDKGIDDQTVFWRMMKTLNTPNITSLLSCSNHSFSLVRPDGIVMCHPHVCHTGVCALTDGVQNMASVLRGLNMKMISVHANCVVGNAGKEQKLRENGLWLSQRSPDNSSYSCKEFSKGGHFEGVVWSFFDQSLE